MAVPDKRFTFDVDRPCTPLDHLRRDFAEGPAWSKRQHFEEWSRLVNKKPTEALVQEEVKHLLNIGYSIHYHVWGAAELLEFLVALREYVQFESVAEEWIRERARSEKAHVLMAPFPMRGAGMPMVRRLASPSGVALLCGAAAFAFQLSVVHHFFVSIPFWDEWDDLVGFVLHYRQGLVTWSDLFAPHMEHRILVARLGFILVDTLFGEASLLGCLVVSAVLMGGIVSIWVYTIRRLGQPLWPIGASLVVLLSVSQHENMLWGFQIQFYTMVLPVVAAICFLAIASEVHWLGLFGLVAACLISTFSMASGLLSWAAVGGALCVHYGLSASPARRVIRHPRVWWQLAAFAAAAGLAAAVYLYDYHPGHPPRGTPESIWTMIRWSGFAFTYPILDPTNPSQARWLPAIVLVEVVPVACAIVMYLRRRDRARLVLMTGLLLMVLTNVAVMATSRSAMVWVASRYGTVCLWGSVVSLVAVADLLRAARPLAAARWAVPCLVAAAVVIVGGQAWRYSTYVEAMRDKRQVMSTFLDNVSTYLTDPSPGRTLRDFEPFPTDRLKGLLDNRSFVRVLPSNLQPRPRQPAASLKFIQALVGHAEWLLATVMFIGGGVWLFDPSRNQAPGARRV
jgi:hypothetical protein